MADFQINDLYLHPIINQSSSKVILRYEDHLLRRFGQVELRHIPAGAQTDFTQRAAADELWAVLQGSVAILLIDRRPQSPTFDVVDEHPLLAREHLALLIPFGVAYALEAEQESQVLRLATQLLLKG